MRLSDFKGEKAVDILADMMNPASVIFKDEEVKKMFTKGSTYMDIGGYILKDHKSEILDIYEILMHEPKENANPIKLIQLVMDIIEDDELTSLFTSQSQLMSSGSATENTEDGEN